MGSKKAPKYPTTKTNTGLWGSSTTGEGGTTYKAPDWMSSAMGTVGNNLNSTVQNMLSNDYSNDANFQAYQNQLYNSMGQQYENMLGNMADRGLMRSSGMQAMNNSYAKALQDNVTSLFDNYYNRQANNLSNLLNTSNNLYNYMTGTTGMSNNQSNAVGQYNLNKWQQEQQNSVFNKLMDAYSNIGSGVAQGAMTAAVASDINVKENIKKIGEKNGYNWYEFNYKNGLGLPGGRQEGVIAQEVEKINPDAVTEINGIKHVLYDRL
jgi:hypothetical protein